MTKDYIDNWGYEVKTPDLKNWIGFEPWEYWSKLFDWNKETNIVEQDIIAFREMTKYELWDGELFLKDLMQNPLFKPDRYSQYDGTSGLKIVEEAKRFVIARVAKIVEYNIFLEVITSEGIKPLSKHAKIIRNKEQIYRYGVYRWPRVFEPDDSATLKNDNHEKTQPQSRFVDIKETFNASSGGDSKGGASSQVLSAVKKPHLPKKGKCMSAFNKTVAMSELDIRRIKTMARLNIPNHNRLR